MKIIIASDSYKHSLSSQEVGDSLMKGILEAMPGAAVRVVPVADGGEGTVSALVDALDGEYAEARVHGPLMDEVTARFGVIEKGRTAVIEMAAASGIELLDEEELDPLSTTTFGTGELILEALERGCTKIIIGLGGSATNDGGAGMLQALGVRLLDDNGEDIPKGGGGLGKLRKIDVAGIDKRLEKTEIILASDVMNPLAGENGATRVYGPQKGAGENEVEELEKNLARFADLTVEVTGEDHRDDEGAGAAGGIGFGCIAYLDARLENGFTLVSRMAGLEDQVKDCDLVITGEGKMDSQTQYGKTPFGVASLSKKHGKPVIGIAGILEEGYEVLYEKGFDALLSITTGPMTRDESISNAAGLLRQAGKAIAGLVAVASRSKS